VELNFKEVKRMDRPKEHFEPPGPTAAELKQALGFGIQQMNVVAGAMHKLLPAHWAQPPLPQDAFYAALLDTLRSPERYAVLRKALDELVARKGKQWRKILLPYRVFDEALSVLEEADPTSYEKAIETVGMRGGETATDDGSGVPDEETAQWLERYVAFPECAAHRRVFRWLVALERCQESDSEQSVESTPGEGTESAVIPEVDPLDTQWDQTFLRMEERLRAGKSARFSRALVTDIARDLEVLEQLIDRKESARDAADAELRDRFLEALSLISALGPGCSVELSEDVTVLRECAAAPEFKQRLRACAAGLGTVEAIVGEIRSAGKQYEELGRLAQEALDQNDDDALARFIGARRNEKSKLGEITAQLRVVLGSLSRVLAEPEAPDEPKVEGPADCAGGATPSMSAESTGGPVDVPAGLAQFSAHADDQEALAEVPVEELHGDTVGVADEWKAVSAPDALIPEVGAPDNGAGFPSTSGERSEPTEPVSPVPGIDSYPPNVSACGLVGACAKRALPTDHAANVVVWTLLRDGALALAYHLAHCLEARGTLALAALDSKCVLAAFLARQIQGPTDEVAETLRDCLGSWMLVDFSQRQVRHRRANSLLAFAAALRPALLAPNVTGARAVLDPSHLPLESTSLDELRAAVIDSARLGLTLTTASLRGQIAPGTWDRHSSELRQRCQEWWDDYRHRRIRYAPTTHVWQRWLEETGPIGSLLKAVIRDDVGGLAAAKVAIDEWTDSKLVNRRLDETDQELRGRNAALRPIDGSPRNDIVRLSTEAMTFVAAWLDLQATRPAAALGEGSPELTDWVRRTRSLLEKAKQELTPALQAPEHLEDHAALSAAVSAIDDLSELLNPNVPSWPSLNWWKRLGEPLLLDPDILLNEHWEPVSSAGDQELLDRILGLASGERDLETAFGLALQRCSHQATARVLEVLNACEPRPASLETLSRRREESIDWCRKRLRDRLREVESSVAHAVDYGYLNEEERSRIAETLESCKGRDRGEIGFALGELDEIDKSLAEHQKARIAEERERLAQNPVLASNPDLRRRIEGLLEQGAISTAAEYVTHAENGREPPSDDQADVFATEYFPGFVNAAYSRLAAKAGGEILRALEGGQRIEPIVPPGDAAELDTGLLRCWHALQGRRGSLPDLVKQLVAALGFTVEGVATEEGSSDARASFLVATQPIRDRSVCVVPQYGSMAQGRYRVVCLWEATVVEDLRKQVGRRDTGPTLLIYFNRMHELQRRELAYQCRKNHATFLVLDEWLLYFLIRRERAARLAAFFDCTFPFTVANPYTPSSSDVPDELFFGRRRAMQQIAELHGTNLVYGGRQLGKTALLREVRRRYHAPDRGFVVMWIDLKAEGIGLGRPLEEVWAVIGGELAAVRLIAQRISRSDTVQKEVVSWLDRDGSRRMLVLLDEADEFFAQDADNGYKTLLSLKSLMERTNRRFKVVFAGLHNVQRMARDVNSPVQHLSRPVCIGPLLDDGEAREAFRLVAMPLRMLGYRLADDVVNHILSYTNYYPNLIQYFCHSLLEFLNDSDQVRFKREETPPYQIKPEQVDEAYRRRELRQFIRDRFQITLDLDPRYRVIALRIALETLERRKRGEETTRGLSVDWIRQQALGLWPIGFKDRTTEAFRTLLDEMIGLGILRNAQRGYALRSPNIVNLVGSHDAIQQDLLDACERAPPPIYTTATFRRAIGVDQWQRSPLVADQEYEILASDTGITLVFGAVLSGIGRVVPAIEAAALRVPEASVQRVGASRDHIDFEKQLRAALGRQKADTNLVLVVDPSSAWNEAWVRCAAQALAHKHGKKTTARVVFVGDAGAAWGWATVDQARQRELGAPRTLTLKPWADQTLRQWQRDTGIGPVNDLDLARVAQATGLWDQVMYDLGGRVRADPSGWREIITEIAERTGGAGKGLVEDCLAIRGASRILVVLASMGEPLSASDLADLAEISSGDEVEHVLAWADLLALIRPVGEGKWEADPFVAKLLADTGV
jgi:hypothetical protein